MRERWGIDLGGTKIEGVILADGGADPVCRLRIDTQQSGGYEHILDRIAEVVTRLAHESGRPRPDRIGLGMPGMIEPSTGLARNCNTTSLNARPLVRDLESKLAIEVVAANDANCFTLAEATLGAAKGVDVVFGVILGTGVGGGIAVGGSVLPGFHGIAGEWGHNELEPDGLPCYCGKRGCVETVLSGPFLERWHETETGQRLSLREIANSSDPAAQRTIAHACEAFGKALSVVVNILDPGAIVVGGGVGNIGALYAEGRRELSKWVFNSGFNAQLLKPQLGDSAGVFGAALLV